jgi:hypothetical protein
MSCRTKPAGLLLLASLLASAVEMALGVPVLEQQFYATVKGATYHNGTEYRTFGSTMYYDPPNQRFREDVSDRRRIADYKNNVGFEIDASGSCTLLQLPKPPALPIVDPSAADVGPATVGGQPAELWRAVVDQQTVIVAVQTQPAAGRNPVRLLTNASYAEPSCACHPTPCIEYPCQVTDVNDYSTDLHVGPMPDSLFAKPANCQPGNETLAFKF